MVICFVSFLHVLFGKLEKSMEMKKKRLFEKFFQRFKELLFTEKYQPVNTTFPKRERKISIAEV